MTEEYPWGTLVRVTQTHNVGDRTMYEGVEVIIDEFVPAGDPEKDYLPYDWYYGQDEQGYSYEVAADKIELVKTAEQMRERKLPTAEEIIRELHCMDDYDGFQIDTADAPDGNSREISGRTSDGLFFACTITVSNVYEADY